MAEKKDKKAAGCLSEIFFYLLAVVVALVSLGLVLFGAFTGQTGPAVLGIVLSVIFAILVFLIPYYRRNVYIRWLAWLALGDAAWWTYVMFIG